MLNQDALKQTVLVVFILSGLMTACSKEDEAKVNVSLPNDSAIERKASGVVPKHQLDTLDRAKNVEALLLQADQERLKQLQ